VRARQPDESGYAVNNGVRLYYEVGGAGEPVLLLVPPYQIAHCRMWKMQVPFLARHFRTVAYDPRGNGRSDWPATDHGTDALVGDALAVLDDAGTERCGLVTVSNGALTCLRLAASHPDRVLGMVLIGGFMAEGEGVTPREEERQRSILADYDAYLRVFWDSIFTEPHSTKPKEDGWAWAQETTPEILVAARAHGWVHVDSRPDATGVRCPGLILHGTRDGLTPYELGLAMYERLPGSSMVTFKGSGHLPNVRDATKVNLLVRDFFQRLRGGA
jgi:pimeloyl-ACP methyl ester carboxylesterase